MARDDDRLRPRLFGGMFAAALAAAVLLGGYALASTPIVEQSIGLRFLLGPEGIPGRDPLATVLAWAAGPLAAFAAGWMQAPRALTGRPWTGAVMGAETYLLSIVFGVLGLAVVDPMVLGGGPGVAELAMAAMFLPILGVVVLAPLLVVCIVSGIVWAAALRTLTRPDDGAVGLPARDGSNLGWFLVTSTAGLIVLWLLVFSSFSGLTGGEFID